MLRHAQINVERLHPMRWVRLSHGFFACLLILVLIPGCAIFDRSGLDTPRKRYAAAVEALIGVQDSAVTLRQSNIIDGSAFVGFMDDVVFPWRGSLVVVRQAFIDGRPEVVQMHLDAAESYRVEGEAWVAASKYREVEP